MAKDIFDIVLVGVQIFTLIFLIVYVKKTWDMAVSTEKSAKISKMTLQEMKEARDQEIAPYVVAYFDIPYGKRLISLVIKNVGKSLAKGVKLEFNPELVNSIGTDFSSIPLIKNGIASMPPGYEIKTFFDFSHAVFGSEELPLTYKVKITYFGGLQIEPRVTEQVLDLSAYKELTSISEKGLHELVKELETFVKDNKEIKNSLEKIKDIIESGIWLKNPEISISNLTQDPDMWKSMLLSRLNEFKTLWTSVYLKEEMREINPFHDDMKNRFSIIGAQILSLSSKYPSEISSELVDDLIEIGTKLFKLGRFHFVIDGRRDRDAFEKFGNEIVIIIDQIIKKLVPS